MPEQAAFNMGEQNAENVRVPEQTTPEQAAVKIHEQNPGNIPGPVQTAGVDTAGGDAANAGVRVMPKGSQQQGRSVGGGGVGERQMSASEMARAIENGEMVS